MSDLYSSGVAFPQPHPFQDGNGNWHYAESPGMSLRDWFATHASEEDVDQYMRDHSGAKAYSREFAKYRYADAMLTARLRGVS